MRRAAALTLTLAALGVAGCGDDEPATDTAPADMPAEPGQRAPSSGSEIAPEADGRESDTPEDGNPSE